MAAAAGPTLVVADYFGGTMEAPERGGNSGTVLPREVLDLGIRHTPTVTNVSLLIAAPVGPMQTMPSARPSSVLFGALNDPEYRLRQPIKLEVTVEESTVVVSWSEVEEFGTGESLSAAISDFSLALRQLYRLLKRNEKLGADLDRIKHVLSDYIEVRPR